MFMCAGYLRYTFLVKLLLVWFVSASAQGTDNTRELIPRPATSYDMSRGLLAGAQPLIFIPPQTKEYEFVTNRGRLIQPLNAPTALKDLQSFNLLGCNPILKLEPRKWRSRKK